MKYLLLTTIFILAFSTAFSQGFHVGDTIMFEKKMVGIITAIEENREKIWIDVAATKRYYSTFLYEIERYYEKQTGLSIKFNIKKVDKLPVKETVKYVTIEHDSLNVVPVNNGVHVNLNQQPNTAAYHINQAAKHSREGKIIGLSAVALGVGLSFIFPPVGAVIAGAGGIVAVVKSFKHDKELEKASKLLNH